ncbi:hypothetical protein MPER_07634, partial [Moniliophthora perniciosa FA553]
AGILTIGIVPWTFSTMLDTNNKLHAKAELGLEGAEIVGEKDTETQDLIKKWGVLNAVRGALPLGGVVVGLIALLW